MTIIELDRRPVLSLHDLCVGIPELPKPLCFTLPGGVEVCVPRTKLSIGVLEYAQVALGYANLVLAPIKPILDMVDLIMSMLDVLYVIPDLITNPSKIATALLKVKDKAIAVAKLVPPLSVYTLLTQIMDALIYALEAFAGEMDSLASFSRRIEAAQLELQTHPGLEDLISCARSSLNAQMSNMTLLFGSLNGIIDIINLVGAIAKQPGFPIPKFGETPGGYGELSPNPFALAAGMREVSRQLQIVRAKMP